MSKTSGLLWFDNDQKKTWQQRVKEAAERYRQKFFIRPNRCYVHGKTVNPKLVIFDSGAFVTELDGIQVYLNDATIPNHFYLFHQGIDPQPQAATQPAEEIQLTLF